MLGDILPIHSLGRGSVTTRWPRISLGVLVPLAVGAVAYLKFSGTPPAEVAERVAEGGGGGHGYGGQEHSH